MLFEKGSPGNPTGRGKGTRNKLSAAFIEALAQDFTEHGAEAIRVARVERPIEYIKVVASLLPKEFEITDNRLKDIDDSELDFLIELARQRRLVAGNTDGREEPTLN